MQIEIVGAGLAGLLAGNMLRVRHKPVIFEAQERLPNNHSAVLRFRSPNVGEQLGISFKKVTMIKAAQPWSNPIADALAYAFKNTGTYRSDRSIIEGMVTAQRWVAPSDLIKQMSDGLHIKYNNKYEFNAINRSDPVISTVPMPVLMQALDYPQHAEFASTSGVNMHAKIANCDAYISLLVPDPAIPISRISITGDDLIVECLGEVDEANTLFTVSTLLGNIPLKNFTNVTFHRQRYAKIVPIDDRQRKLFMFWATDRFGIFSLGRFATWRPNLLMDDLIQDVKKIASWIDNKYDLVKQRK
jgi:hypothetical protein